MRVDDVMAGSSAREWAFLGVGVVLSIVLHTLLAAGAAMIPADVEDEPEWVEMTFVAPPPPPPPPEAPKPAEEPEKPRPEALKKPPVEKKVDLKDLPKEEPKPTNEPPKRVARAVQGLSNDSFAQGAGGFGARQGNTTSTAATAPSDPNAGAFQTVRYDRVGTAPKIRVNPPIEVPQAVSDAHVSGRVEMEVTIGPDGRIVDAVVIGPLQPAADAACVAHAKQKVRFTPGSLDGAAVIVTGVPYSCRFEEGA
jgi:protein TonB